MKHLIVALLMLSVIDFSIIDSRDDNTKNIIFIHWSDGSDDRLVVDKDKLDTPETLKAVDQIIRYRKDQQR